MKSLKNFKTALAAAVLMVLIVPAANATITIKTVTGVSGLNPPLPYLTSLDIWGTTTGINSITPTTEIAVTFVSTVAGYPMAYAVPVDGTTTSQVPINDNVSAAPVAAGSVATVRIPWTNVCRIGFAANKKCADDDLVSLAIGVSTSAAVMTGTESFPISAEIFGPAPDFARR